MKDILEEYKRTSSLCILKHQYDSDFSIYIIQGIPEKASHIQNEITLKIWDHKSQFRCFWNAEISSFFFI